MPTLFLLWALELSWRGGNSINVTSPLFAFSLFFSLRAQCGRVWCGSSLLHNGWHILCNDRVKRRMKTFSAYEFYGCDSAWPCGLMPFKLLLTWHAWMQLSMVAMLLQYWSEIRWKTHCWTREAHPWLASILTCRCAAKFIHVWAAAIACTRTRIGTRACN